MQRSNLFAIISRISGENVFVFSAFVIGILGSRSGNDVTGLPLTLKDSIFLAQTSLFCSS